MEAAAGPDLQRSVSAPSTIPAAAALCFPIAPALGRETPLDKIMLKIQPRTETQPRRIQPMPDMDLSWGTEDSVSKGRKHEAFDTGFFSGERRGLARAMRYDRKR